MQFRMIRNATFPGGGATSDWRSARFYRTAIFAGLLAVVTLAGVAQGPPIAHPNPSIHSPLVTSPPDANEQMRMHAEKAKQQSYDAANSERIRQIANDSARLLQLANELKIEVDKTDKDTLSLAVIRKAEEIELLAHDVKAKMKLTVGSN